MARTFNAPYPTRTSNNTPRRQAAFRRTMFRREQTERGLKTNSMKAKGQLNISSKY